MIPVAQAASRAWGDALGQEVLEVVFVNMRLAHEYGAVSPSAGPGTVLSLIYTRGVGGVISPPQKLFGTAATQGFLTGAALSALPGLKYQCTGAHDWKRVYVHGSLSAFSNQLSQTLLMFQQSSDLPVPNSASPPDLFLWPR